MAVTDDPSAATLTSLQQSFPGPPRVVTHTTAPLQSKAAMTQSVPPALVTVMLSNSIRPLMTPVATTSHATRHHRVTSGAGVTGETVLSDLYF